MPSTGFLSRLLEGRTARPRVPCVTLDAKRALWAVGDVHGCLDLYREIEARIMTESSSAQVVLLGDVIDRGPDSRGMIAHLLDPAPEGMSRLCLLGNHEDMALRFLANPVANADWLRWGGRETVVSYVPDADGDDPAALAAALVAAMPQDHLAFLRSLPVMALSEGYVLTHAGAGPEVALNRQSKKSLVWDRHGEIEDLLPPSDLGGRIVVHGHVPVARARRSGWRINIDTGAYATGRLSAVRLTGDDAPRFVTVGEGT